MSHSHLTSTWRPLAAALFALVIVAGPAWGQERSSSSSRDREKDSDTVVRTFGTEGGFRTEVTTRTKGKLTEEEFRQASLLTAEVFQHINKAREALEAEDSKEALKHVNKAREAIKAVREMLPTTTIRTRTTGPDGKVVYEDDTEVQPRRIPLYEALLHTQTLAPILAARRNAMEIAGVHVVEAETVATQVLADLNALDAYLTRAARELEHNKSDEADKALAMALIRGLEMRYNKEDSELASARDAIWMARRALEENNPTQALVNLAAARQRLMLYRQVVSEDQRKEVDQMLREVEQLEAQLRQEGNHPVSAADRARQGRTVTHWWDRINSWFRRHI